MALKRRLAFVASFLTLAAVSAAATVGVARLATGAAEEPPVPTVAGAQKTIVAGVATTQPRRTTPRRTVVQFLDALRDGDYARACDQILRAAGCEDQLAATNAGVTDFRLVATKVRGTNAVVDAIADGMPTRFTLLRRSARWWIAALAIDR